MTHATPPATCQLNAVQATLLYRAARNRNASIALLVESPEDGPVARATLRRNTRNVERLVAFGLLQDVSGTQGVSSVRGSGRDVRFFSLTEVGYALFHAPDRVVN